MQVEKIELIDNAYIYRQGNMRTVVFDGAYYQSTLPIDPQDTPIQNVPFVVTFSNNGNNNNFYGVVRNVGDIAVYAGASGSGIKFPPLLNNCLIIISYEFILFKNTQFNNK